MWAVIEVSTFVKKIVDSLVRAQKKVIAAESGEIDKITVAVDVFLPCKPFLR
jgi:hypothetical protein